MVKIKYVVTAGKHCLPTGEYVRAGEICELTEEEAAKFVGKFKKAEIIEDAIEVTSPDEVSQGPVNKVSTKK